MNKEKRERRKTWGRCHQHTHTAFSRAQDEKLFWHTNWANREKHFANFNSQIWLKFFGEIELQIFYQTLLFFLIFFLVYPIWLPVFSYFSILNQNWVKESSWHGFDTTSI